MTVRYVVSIADTLLYFDADRQPSAPLPDGQGEVAAKPALRLIPPSEHPAADPAWDAVLADYTDDQRRSAEVSEVL